MMRPLHRSVLCIGALCLLASCDDDEARMESARAQTRDSLLSRDLALASDSVRGARDGADAAMRATRTVSTSSGAIVSDVATSSPAGDVARNASASTTPSAEGYIGPSCASPAPDDQRRCLLGYLARSDVQLDHSYQALIGRLRSEAGTKVGAPDPPAVQRLRATQRAWLVYRDDECRKRTLDSEGPLWAPVRAKCLAEYSTLRVRELDDALAQRKPTVEPKHPTKQKVVKHTKRSRSKRRSRR